MLEDLVAAAVNAAVEKARDAADEHMAKATGGIKIPGSGLLMAVADPIARLVKELAKLPGIGEKTAQRLAFHILKARPELRRRPRRRDRRRDARRPALLGVHDAHRPDPCAICARPAPRRARSSASSSHPDLLAIERTARVPRALPRAPRRALAARRHRPRRPAHPRAARAARAASPPTRSSSPPTPTSRARRPRSTSRSCSSRSG